MVRAQLIGRLFPSGPPLSITYKPEIEFSEPTLNFKATFVIDVEASHVHVTCEMPDYRPDQRNLLIGRATDFAQCLIDLVSFATGEPRSLVFETIIEPDGFLRPLRVRHPELGKLVSSVKFDESFLDIHEMVSKSPEIFLALRDLIQAIDANHSMATNCGRVLDGIRRIIAPKMDKKSGWEVMQQALNISQSYQEWISKKAADQRHADRSYIPEDEVAELRNRTWMIMNRLFEYKKRGDTWLKGPEFPLLP